MSEVNLVDDDPLQHPPSIEIRVPDIEEDISSNPNESEDEDPPVPDPVRLAATPPFELAGIPSPNIISAISSPGGPDNGDRAQADEEAIIPPSWTMFFAGVVRWLWPVILFLGTFRILEISWIFIVFT